MSSPTIRVALPLADAQSNRRTGGKAVLLSKLAAAGFAVPRGFVLTADAYRSHLWSTGAREIASADADAEQREEIRAAILAQPIPDDVWSAAAEAYERLSWQSGIPDPKVAVRSSALEDSRDGSGFAGGYESYLNISGAEALHAAIKRVWASLWSGKAAAYRARFGGGEPAMAVIVQQMVETDATGSAFTANPVTGDPTSVMVTIRRSGQSSRYRVDLRDFSVAQDECEPGITDEDFVRVVAEKAILVEDAIGARAEVEWAADDGGLWILQAAPIADLPAFFPTDRAQVGDAAWERRDGKPLSHFSRSLLAASKSPERVLNGYLYVRAAGSSEGQLSGSEWDKRIKPPIRERAAAVIGADFSQMDDPALDAALKSAAQDARVSRDWFIRAEREAACCIQRLREVIGDQGLLWQLLEGIQDAVFERDALLQELSERFAIAEKSGKLENEKWWRTYRGDVEQLAKDYGYAFRDAGEAADTSRWRGWIEDKDSVFRIIGAISKRGSKPTLVTLNSAAQDASAAALASVNVGKPAMLKKLVESSGKWLRLRADAEQICALASAALRLALMEKAGRLLKAGSIASRDDAFNLSLEELTAVSADRRELAALIARRKHENWLERRLTPPVALPLNGDTAPQGPHGGVMTGIAASPGTAAGRARIVTSIEDAAEIEVGDIIITSEPSSAWTPFLTIAGGLVCESGWDFSPAAILARTYGIPAIVGCEGALSIKDGGRTVVDGSAGVVKP